MKLENIHEGHHEREEINILNNENKESIRPEIIKSIFNNKNINKIEKIGICSYLGKNYFVFVCSTFSIPGSGDYEDDTYISEDQNKMGYVILYQNLLDDANIQAEGGYYHTIEEILNELEQSNFFVKWIN